MSGGLPREVKPGEPMDVGQLNALRDYVRSLAAVAGPGIDVDRTAGGTAYRATARPSDRFPALFSAPTAGAYPWVRRRYVAGSGWSTVGGWSGVAYELGGQSPTAPFQGEVFRDPASGLWFFQAEDCDA